MIHLPDSTGSGVALKEKRLEEANQIQANIKTLEAETEELKSGRVKGGITTEDAMADEALLAGGTIVFPHPNDPNPIVFFSFQKDGKALWLGQKNQAISRKYKPTGKPRQFLLWWPDRGNQGNFQITVGAEGKTAELILLQTGKSVLGIIKETE